LAQTRLYLANWLDRRRQRDTPNAPLATGALAGELLFGWHAPETQARWTADFAAVRIPAEGVSRVWIEFHLDAGRSLRVHQGGRLLGEATNRSLELEPAQRDRPELLLEVTGVRVTKEQRRHGDARRLGCAVTRIAWSDPRGEHVLDLGAPAAVPLVPVNLTRDRFELPLNRSVVRFGDAFLCHSRYVAERILRERNASTPLGLVHHGSLDRWRDGDRKAARRALGLPPEWVDSCLIVSFGGVQPHKRIERIFAALARARRERADIRLILAGSMHSSEFDPVRQAAHLGLADAVKFTGYLSEVEAWDWLHAADLAINLRGPTTGGTSGGIFQAFSMGRAVIASDAAEQKELPNDCVVRVPLGEGEVETLARELVLLRDDPARRARLEEGVRRFVREECHWRVVAKKYAEHLASFPRARASRRKLISLRVGLQRSAL
jgi:glycosyltransferase involved in cell wall biosynthesis